MVKRKKRYKPEGTDTLLIKLERITRKPGSDREMAGSLVRWHLTHKYWTPKQRTLARALVHRSKTETPEKPVKYHLYAIGDGECVKLGLSNNVGRRLNDMQTGHPKKLKVLWKFFVGRERTPAYKAEKKLHRFCKKYKVRGEWFRGDCMTIVEQFSLKEKITMENEQEQHDMSLLANPNAL